MAKPAFIYAFDNLGPDRFTELCGLLLASRYKGFLLGGIGADGGVDAEIDQNLGIWRPESQSPFLNEIIKPNEIVVFQFKHKVTARVGQVATRKQLINLYRCRGKKKCELHSNLIMQKRPSVYVLVTNVEVNSVFRDTFIKQCQKENPSIRNYQVVGLDELETWITNEHELRHLFLPAIFGPSRFKLQVRLNMSFIGNYDSPENTVEALAVSVLNEGVANSYVSSVTFNGIVDGESRVLHFLPHNHPLIAHNPKSGALIEPGRKLDYFYPRQLLRDAKNRGKDIFLVEVIVRDELGNEYTVPIHDNVRNWILLGPDK
jgi:hypothetical protein